MEEDSNAKSVPPVSLAWKYFQKIEPEQDGEKPRVQCGLCNTLLTYNNTTTTMLRHLKSKHKDEGTQPEPEQESKNVVLIEENDGDCQTEHMEATQYLVFEHPGLSLQPIAVPLPVQGDDSTSSSPPAKKQKKMNTGVVNTIYYPKASRKKRNLDGCLVRMVARDLQPFSVVEDKGFKDLVSALDPRYQMPSRKTLKAMMQRECDTAVIAWKEELKSVTDVSITTDAWTSVNNDSFLAITCHFFTAAFELKSWLIDVCRITENHTVGNVGEILQKALVDWDIQSKVVCVTTDNASDVVASVRALNFSHMGCYAHTLNSVVTESIEAIAELKCVKDKMKMITTHFKQDATAREMLEKAQLGLNRPVAKLISDTTEARWNSVYLLMQRCVNVREALSIVLESLDGLPQLSATDWEVAEECLKVLEPFFKFTEEMSKETSVSVSLVIPITRLLQKATLKLAEEYGALCSRDGWDENPARALALKLNQELTRRCGDVESSRICGITTLLDPRFKKLVFANGGKLESAVQKVRQEAHQLYQQSQASTMDENEDAASRTAAAQAEGESSFACSIWSDFDEEVCRQGEAFENYGAKIENELHAYFTIKNIPRSESPWTFWKANEQRFSTLAPVARKYLCVQGTSVPSERVFSKCGELFSIKRSRLKESTVRLYMLLNSNK